MLIEPTRVDELRRASWNHYNNCTNPLDICVDSRAVYDAISAVDACEFAGSSLKLHRIPARDRMTRNPIRRLYWVYVRDMLADGLSKGGVDRTSPTRVCNECRFQATHGALVRTKHGDFGLRCQPLQGGGSSGERAPVFRRNVGGRDVV